MRVRCGWLALLVPLGGCAWLAELDGAAGDSGVAEPAAEIALREPASSHQFVLEEGVDVVGELQIVSAGADDTLTDIARRFDVGYDELALANPGVDPWLVGEGTPVVLPTAHILPRGPREGIVINLAALRLFYYPPPDTDGHRRVLTHPIGIGRLGWATPTGDTQVTGKARDPTWYVPLSVRQEHAEAGDPLPAVVPPGPDNPLGAYVLTLGLPSYLIHGTNKPAGVGMRVSHGCIRLYPEDIEALFERIPLDTPVTIVNQPYLVGWRDGRLLLEAHGPLEDDERPWHQVLLPVLDAALAEPPEDADGDSEARLDWARLGEMVRTPRGLPLPIESDGVAVDALLAALPKVENRLPDDSNWDGRIEYRMEEEELEALLEDRSEPRAANEPSAGRGAAPRPPQAAEGPG